MFKKISNIFGMVFIMLGVVPVPVLNQVGSVYAADLTGSDVNGLQLPEFTSYAGLLGSTAAAALDLPDLSSTKGDWLSKLISGPVLACDGEDCTPDVADEGGEIAPPAEEPDVAPPTEEIPPVESPEVTDKCPDDDAKLLPGVCGCGISDVDTDLDGTKDCEDSCPLDALNQCEPQPVVSDSDPSSSEGILTEVAAMAEAELVVVNESDEVVPISSTEAAEILQSADPYFTTTGGEKYCYIHSGETCAGDCTSCVVSTTPIQDAVDAAVGKTLVGDRIYVEPGTYAEHVTIYINGMTLYGLPASVGAAVNSPVLDGGTISGGVGVSITAKGVTLQGFTIQNYNIGVLANASSGNVSINILNNTIKDNKIGIKNLGGTGKPQLEVHYNKFEDNDIAIDNNSESHNIQYIQAQHNEWGCPEGPFVKTFWGYYSWSTEAYSSVLPVGCEVVYGRLILWNYGMPSGGEYKPYKIRIGDFYFSGCMDPDADNYLAKATYDDGTCEIGGCMDPDADNYLAKATYDDGSCEIGGYMDPDAPNYQEKATYDNESCEAYCGDGAVDEGETCDGGENCREDCTYCGDEIVNGEETCDGEDYCSEECSYREFADLELDPHCVGVGTLGWSVTNPNPYSVPNTQVVVDGNLKFDSTFPAILPLEWVPHLMALLLTF